MPLNELVEEVAECCKMELPGRLACRTEFRRFAVPGLGLSLQALEVVRDDAGRDTPDRGLQLFTPRKEAMDRTPVRTSGVRTVQPSEELLVCIASAAPDVRMAAGMLCSCLSDGALTPMSNDVSTHKPGLPVPDSSCMITSFIMHNTT